MPAISSCPTILQDSIQMLLLGAYFKLRLKTAPLRNRL